MALRERRCRFFASGGQRRGVRRAGGLYALNASTGALLWSYNTEGQARSSPAVANGVVYVGSLDNNVYALNASTGALLWKYTTGTVLFLRRRWLTAWCTSGPLTITCTP